MRLKKLFLHVASSLWFVPVLCVLAGVAISFGTIALDRYFDYEALPPTSSVGPMRRRRSSATVAASMVSLTALVLTITMVVVQLAMGQFSPRIVQRILQDKPSQFAIGLFVATFVHAILAAARGDEQRRRHRQRARDRRRDGVRARPRQHRGARHLRPPHRTVAARLVTHRARRQGHAEADRSQVPGRGPCRRARARRTGRSCAPDARVSSPGSATTSSSRRRSAPPCMLELAPALGEFVPAGRSALPRARRR